MLLNRATDIGLRVLMLAAATNGRHTIDDLAESLVVPRHHLAKVVQTLQHLNLLDTVRGRHGGVSLAEGAVNVSVGGVVRTLEADEEVVDCDEPAACPLRHACRLRRALWQAQEAFYASLDEVTIGDLTRKPSGEVLLSLGRSSS
ncbi:Rrf2 family transcriptional regulator [Actinoplanes sp. TBRC 11911]|uniref:RrF2 family transcriptional regulator n=1 Tax=Actinoplanes sp. TBRC 11911 TaxID=2729386 RepID=UPI00145C6252|nr:Rrf2 family transcriptional regulator [Actinoplanes sp. TBRC 11911]NMO49600.1 Rrf2 family transcriptional regulator [Actinoplanes sp. TBRC 11911]